ncbi:hypothetical protein KFU94_11955 [Chloroflexi bacterium TSY]|nr:hypothetical protein [Chloroflexi bacterium TSY]
MGTADREFGGIRRSTSTIQIRFWFDTVSSTFNNFEGWYIDDVRLLTAKLELPGDKVPMPNLVVEESNIGFSPSNPVEGERVRINATILNNGTTEANDVIVQFVDITDGGAVPIGQPQTISNLPVGGSGMAQVSYGRDTVAGELEIQAIVDPNNFIAEQNESDNAASRILTIAPAPAPIWSFKAPTSVLSQQRPHSVIR